MNETAIWNVEENLNKIWKKVADDIKRVAEEVIVESMGSIPVDT